jgi:hypothetical protein
MLLAVGTLVDDLQLYKVRTRLDYKTISGYLLLANGVRKLDFLYIGGVIGV